MDEAAETVLVGGVVRDLAWFDEESNDWDFAAKARPEAVMATLERHGYHVIPTGIAFGTVTVMLPDKVKVEVTSYRQEEYDGVSRKPLTRIAETLEADLGRRDLTANAMAMRRDGSIVDPYGGMKDLEAGVLRCVGDAKTRFLEDPLRILRVARFSARYGFAIEAQTAAQMGACAPEVLRLSGERVQEELFKLLKTRDPVKGIQALQETGVLAVVLPELEALRSVKQAGNPHHVLDAYGHSLEALRHCCKYSADPVTRLAVLLHDIGKATTETMDATGCSHYYGHDEAGASIWKALADRIKVSNAVRTQVAFLIENHLKPCRYETSWRTGTMRRIIREAREDLDRLIVLAKSDAEAHAPASAHASLAAVEAFETRIRTEAARTPLGELLQPGTGLVLMDAFNVNGPAVGMLLAKARDAVLNEELPHLPSPDTVVAYLRK